MNLTFIKKFPKFALVAGVFIVSTGLFAIWWYSRGAHSAGAPNSSAQVGTTAETAKRVSVDFEAGKGRYFLADDDLYDAEAGQLVAKNFLNGEKPAHLLYEPESKKLIGEFANGFIRFGLDGSKEATLLQNHKVAVVPGSKKIVYVKAGDIWVADVDLKQFKLLNERKITSLGQFDEINFSDNMMLLTDKLALLRNQNQIVRVDLESGQVKPARTSMKINAKTRSPDSRTVVGIDVNTRQFYAYDFDNDEIKTKPAGRLSTLTDATWLDTNRCLVLVNRAGIALYDRRTDKLEEMVTLPNKSGGARRMAEPSPDGRFVFVAGDRAMGLLDVANKSLVPLDADVQGYFWVGDDTLIFTRETMDTDRRGTWLKKIGGTETRITDEPFNLVLPLKEAGLVVFQTKSGLKKVKMDGGGVEGFTASSSPIIRVSNIERFVE